MKRVEAAIQKAVIRLVHDTYPGILVSATQNEKSFRDPDQIGSPGITDLILLCRRGCIAHILFLELKRKDGMLLESQEQWNEDFDEGFACDNCKRDVAYGYSHAVAIIAAWHKSLPEDVSRNLLTYERSSI